MSITFDITLPAKAVSAVREIGAIMHQLEIKTDISHKIREIIGAVIDGVEKLSVDIVQEIQPAVVERSIADSLGWEWDPHAKISVTFRDLMMREEKFTVPRYSSIGSLLQAYCERTGTDIDTLVFISEDFKGQLTQGDHHGSLASRSIREDMIILVEPYRAQQIELVFCDAMKKEHRMTLEDYCTVDSALALYASNNGFEVDQLKFTSQGKLLGFDRYCRTLKESGLHHGSIIDVCPMPPSARYVSRNASPTPWTRPLSDPFWVTAAWNIVKDVKLIFRNAMNQESDFLCKESDQISSVISRYIEDQGFKQGDLDFKHRGASIRSQMKLRKTLRELDLTDGSIIEVTPKPRSKIHGPCVTPVPQPQAMSEVDSTSDGQWGKTKYTSSDSGAGGMFGMFD